MIEIRTFAVRSSPPPSRIGFAIEVDDVDWVSSNTYESNEEARVAASKINIKSLTL
jgi:hypothetical protein